MLMRMAGTPMEGVAFAILFMNIVTPYIQRIPNFKSLKGSIPSKGKGATK